MLIGKYREQNTFFDPKLENIDCELHMKNLTVKVYFDVSFIPATDVKRYQTRPLIIPPSISQQHRRAEERFFREKDCFDPERGPPPLVYLIEERSKILTLRLGFGRLRLLLRRRRGCLQKFIYCCRTSLKEF